MPEKARFACQGFSQPAAEACIAVTPAAQSVPHGWIFGEMAANATAPPGRSNGFMKDFRGQGEQIIAGAPLERLPRLETLRGTLTRA